MKEDTYTENPKIRYKYNALLVLGTTNKNYIWSTFSKFNNLQRNNFALASVKAQEFDVDLNGRNEKLNLELSVPLPDTASVHSVELLLFFEYQLFVRKFVIS